MESRKSRPNPRNRRHSEIFYQKDPVLKTGILRKTRSIQVVLAFQRRKERYSILYVWKLLEKIIPNIGGNGIAHEQINTASEAV